MAIIVTETLMHSTSTRHVERGNQRWPRIKGWAAELGMSSAAAIIRVGTSDSGGTQS
jgi:hypothetical protein